MTLFAKLSPVQASQLVLARQHADDDTRKAIKKDIFAVVKERFDIPAGAKLSAATGADEPDYLVVKFGKTSGSMAGLAFPLDDITGKFVPGTARLYPSAPVAAPVDARLWFSAPLSEVVAAYTGDDFCDQDDAVSAPDGAAPGADFHVDGDTVYFKAFAD